MERRKKVNTEIESTQDKVERVSAEEQYELDYQSDVSIDQDNLDKELLIHPSLTFRYNAALAHYQLLIDRMKEKINILKSQLDTDIRKNPTEYELAKVTNEAITNLINSHPKLQELNMDLISMNYDRSMLQAAVYSLNDKKHAIENLIKLFNANYFSAPSIPLNLSREWVDEQKEKRARKTIRLK